MNFIRRQVLLILALLGGALCVILLYPRNSVPAAAPAQGPESAAAPSAIADPAGEEVSAPKSEKREPKRLETVPEMASAEQERTSPADPIAIAEPSIPAPEPVTPDRAIERLLQKRVDLTDPLARQDLVAKIQRLEAVKQRETLERASALGFPLRTEDGAVLVGFDGEIPLYDEDHNANAAITTGANLVQAAPFNASGSGFIFGLWEAGDVPRASHQELFPRVTVIDGQTSMDMHASHVAGTLIAAGIDPLVRGMAPGASIKAHDTSSELSEMTALAAAAVGTPGAIYLSNHSYGSSVGWNDAKTAWYGSFSDDGDPGNDYSSLFGRYNSTASSWDGLAWNAPYYLIFKSAGNDRNDAAPAEGATWNLNGSPSNQYLYDSITHPVADYDWQTDGVTGFGTIGPRASAKNIITVGSVTDAVSGGVRNVGVASLNDFSSAGPTDDGRIKPDLMANGNSLRSLDKDSDTDQATASGTSMSTPNACGSAMLLIDYYNQLYPGQAMLSSSLKGLLIHTADDIGNPGPDYRHGWGLMNVTAAAQLLEDHANVVTGERLVEGELDGLNPEDEVTISHNGSGPLRVTICWTDPAGSSIASHNSRAKRLVHDLNLSVTGPAGTHLPYVMPWVDDWSNSKLDDPAVTGVNNVDNVEQVYLAAPVAGSYTIRVDHLGLAQGSQKYSLILSGAAIQTGPPVVTVVNPVDDMAFVGDSPATIQDVADVTSIFSAEAVSFDISASPAGILNAVIDGGNNVDLTPTTTAFGTVTVTLSATDANDNVAEDSFEVTIASPIFYVDASTPAAPTSQDGFSWATAYAHLQDALLLAQCGQEIWVATGTYYPDLTNALDSGNKNDAFVVPAGVSVYGGFLPGDSSLDDADPWTNNVTLNGNIGGGQKSYNVVDLSACDATAVFDGFIITNGAATDATKHSGGGIYSNGGSATISRCQLTSNSANQKGGAICLLGGAPIVTGCDVSTNVGNQGGGLYLENSAGEILNSQVTNNTASVNGGGVCLIGGTPLVKGCTVSDNGGNRGGAFYLDNSAARIVNCQSARNNAATDGGGMWTQNSSGVLVHGCEFRGNVGSGPGSLGVNGGSVSVVSSLFSGGQAWFGSGGVEIKAGSIDLVNCTVTANYSWAQEGGGLLVSGATTGSNVYNCIIWNNQAAFSTADPGSSIGHSGAPDPQVHHSLVHNSAQSGAWSVIGFDGGGNIDVDPAFTAPVDPNGSGDDGGDFTVPANSAALNGGSVALLPADVADVDGDGDFGEVSPLDLAGAPREVSTSVDMGAFEFGDLDLLDADNDGISDAYEFVHAGDYVSINPFDDLDGDGLTALAEFAHGLDPATGLSAPVGALTAADFAGVDYLTITYNISDEALNLLQITVERRTDLDDPYGWKGGETVLLSSDPVAGQPGMTRVVARSTVPFGTTRCEFLRIKHEQLP